MNVKYITSNNGLRSVLAAKDTYFIVEQDISLDEQLYTLGSGSIIEFIGGCFKGTDTTLNLNGGEVIAGPYPIFCGIEVTGFSNDKIYAEWFNDNGTTAPHTYINKALRLAKGCPVVLAHNEYNLTGTIVFPSTSPSTLIAHGALIIDTVALTGSDYYNPVAIDINVSNVRLDINRIEFSEEDTAKNVQKQKKTVSYRGTGIRISCQVFHVDINVNEILYANRGIDISPGRNGTYANIQYLNVKFQSIVAVYGIYMDIYASGNAGKNRVTRASFHGGRLQGNFGVYMANPQPGAASYTNITEILFSNIGFESITKTAIRLWHASRLKFENLRMAESLPEEKNPWIDLTNVSLTDFDIHGDLITDKIIASGTCSKVTVKGSFLKNTDWYKSPFDTLIFDSVWINDPSTNYRTTLKALTCSTRPFPMTNLITTSSDVRAVQPEIIAPVSGKFNGLRVLPAVLYFKFSSTTTIDLKSLADYAPCIFYFYLENGAQLNLKTLNTPISTIEVTGSGYYQLMWVTDNNTRQLQVNKL